jgi:peptide/nickel transport system substrate-binding protein
MIELRRSFAAACGLTVFVVLLLAACDFRTPAESAQATPAASIASASAPASAATAEASAQPTASATPAPSPTPSVPQGGALAIRLAADAPDLKPWDLRSRGEEVVADLMYSGLTRLDPQLRPQPDLAESWTTSPDGGLITFTLRSGMTWHDGQPLTSDDVVWTLNTLRTITPTNALLFDLRSTIGQVRSPLTETVVLSLTQPYAPLLAELAVPILPRHRLQSRPPEQIAGLNFWDEPVGSGPFKFDQRQPNQSITFTRNEQFYRGAPNIDQIALVVAPDPTVAATALREGQLQAAEFPGQVAPLTDTDQPITSGAYPENGWYGVVFNTRADRLFADQRLRAALARALDINDLVQAVTGGVGQSIATTLSRAAWAYPADLPVLPPDLDAARQLLDQAGWTVGPDGVRQKNGQPLAALLWVRGDDPRRLDAAQRIAQAAQAIGMQLEVTPANFDTVILAKLAPPYDFDLLLGSWVNAPNAAGFPTNRFYDPDDFALFHSSRIWQGQGDPRTALRNVGGFSNADYDAAAEQARSAYDPAARAQAILQSQTVLVRELPYVLLWTDRITVALSERIKSAGDPISPDTPRYLWNIEQWYLEP